VIDREEKEQVVACARVACCSQRVVVEQVSESVGSVCVTSTGWRRR
jgi:hypothetical protein